MGVEKLTEIRSEPSPDRPRALLGAAVAALLALIVFSAVQLATPHPVGVDGLFHIQSANLIRDNLPRPWMDGFHWLEHTSLQSRRFADFYWGFHLVLVPFTLLPVERAAKLAPVVLSTSSLLALFFVMVRLRVRLPLLWFALALLASPIFLMRLSQNKAPTVMLGLLLLLAWAAAEGRARLVGLFAALASWVYPVVPLIAMIAGAAMVADWGCRRRLPWRSMLALAAGVAAGLLIHPDVPRNLGFLWVNLQEAMKLQAGEFRPLRTDVFMADLGPLLLLLVVGVRHATLDRRREGATATWAFLLSASVALGITARHMRGVDFLPPFVAAFAGLALGTPLAGWIESLRRRLGPRAMQGATVAVVVAAVALGGYQVARARHEAARNSTRVAHRLEGAARWLAGNTEPGELVLNLTAGDFEQLWAYNTHNTYFVGFNVNFLQRESPELFRQYARFYEGGDPQAVVRLLELTRARYAVATDRLPRNLVRRLMGTPELESVYSDGSSVILRKR